MNVQVRGFIELGGASSDSGRRALAERPRPLELTGIDSVVAVYRSLDEGLAAFADA
jgi:hypothetical protein